MKPPTRTPAEIRQRARQLRQEMTPAERTLWPHLRAKRLGGLKFRRQHPLLGRFIADFCCPARRLVIEIDGDIHDWQREQDKARTQELERHGYRVIRFQNHQVLNSLEGVLAAIHAICTEPPRQEGGPAGEDKGPQPSPLAGGPGGR